MEFPHTIADLCRKYGVSTEFGNRLRPLFERARESQPEKQRRLLEIIERSFAEEARRNKARMKPQDLAPEEFGLVRAVARALHAWDPPLWLRLWQEAQRRSGDDWMPLE